MQLTGIPAREVPVVWAAVADQIKIATELSGGRHTPETVKEACRNAEMQLWCVIDPKRNRIVAVLVTEVKTFKTGLKVCELVLLAGRQRDKWVHLVKDIERWAHSLGCVKTQALGRDGWVRVMKTWNWDNSAIFIEKNLKEYDERSEDLSIVARETMDAHEQEGAS